MAELPGIDYSQYQNWEVMQAPTGATYYVVPGTGYVYDPFLSNAKGRPVLFTNPRPQLDAKKKEEDAIKKQNSFAGQAAQLGGPIGGALLGSAALKYGDKFVDWTMAPTAEAAATPLTNGAVAAPEIVSGSLGGTSSAGGASAAAPGFLANASSMGALPLAAIAGATYLGGKSAYDMLQGKTDNSIPGIIGRGTLGIATGGLSEVARPFLNRETTRDVAKRHTKDLLGQSDDQKYQNYVTGMREQYNSAPVDPSKPFAGKYGSWDEYQKAGLEAADLTGVYGNLKTFGKDWTNLNFDQQKQVTQGLIDAGLYKSKKGEVEITDANKARQIKDQVLGITKQAPVPDPASAVELGKKLGTRLNKK